MLKKYKVSINCRVILEFKLYNENLLINNNEEMNIVKTDIYPPELDLIPDKNDDLSTPFLDLLIFIKDSFIFTKIFVNVINLILRL